MMNTAASSKKKSKYIVLAAVACLLFFIAGLLIGHFLPGKTPENRPAGTFPSGPAAPQLSGAPDEASSGDGNTAPENSVSPAPSGAEESSDGPTPGAGPDTSMGEEPSGEPTSDVDPDTSTGKEPSGEPTPDVDPDTSSGEEPSGEPTPTAGPDTSTGQKPSAGPSPTGQPTATPAKQPTPVPKPSATPKPTPKPTTAPSTPVSSGNGSVSANGQLQVIGTQLCNASGEPIVLRGISTAGIAWFPELATKESMQTLRDEWKTSVFRIAMYSFEGDRSYIRNPEWNKTKVCSLIDAAIELDQYVIVDWHILADGNPQTYQKQAVEFFTYIASRYAGVPNLLYEICNEPNGGVSWSGNIKPYAETVIPVIREYSPEAVILVGTPTWSQDVDAAAADPLSFDNVMYSLHFYAGTHKEWLRSKADTALSKGLPLFVTEWGTTDASGNGAVDTASTLEWLSYLDRNQISWCNWSLCNKAESSALLRPSAPTNGTMPESALTESGKLVKKQLLARAGTETGSGSSGSVTPTAAPKPTGGSSDPAAPTAAPKPTGDSSDLTAPTAAPKPTGSAAGSDPGTAGGLVLESYNENREPASNTISPRFRLQNTGSAGISLSSVILRYYYTPESGAEQKLWCDYAEVNGSAYRAITDAVAGVFISGDGWLVIRFSVSAGAVCGAQLRAP
ncbi:MAG: cellulase family glycosylhydrolase, partial [Lachnospiraceae bacterium]|nr:cellulase family glycosylhydrolase [Lachnospiraceae bacterium]